MITILNVNYKPKLCQPTFEYFKPCLGKYIVKLVFMFWDLKLKLEGFVKQKCIVSKQMSI